MTEPTADYTFILVRPNESWRDFELRCDEHRVSITYRPGFENGLAIAAQAIRNAGAPDGSVAVIEKRRSGLRQWLPSLYRVSEMPVGYIRVTEPGEFEPKVVARPAVAAPKVGGMSRSVFKTLGLLLADPKAWADVAGVTKGALKEAGHVEVRSKTEASVTETGRAAYEAAQEAMANAEAEGEAGGETAGQTPAAPEPVEAAVPAAPKTPDVFVTPRQRDALGIVLNEPAKWVTLHGKTRNWLVNEGWVRLDSDTPALTEKGAEVAKAIGVSQ